ncbi:kinase-like domain-containing protein [Xylaria bambusicola]|uniref:kinase-like domain-containing protein n=1 Tax=Xylaria bambusicola TaxID=326684 RepID=UPI002007A4B8|nr:kinase-like domain-containing protein [Xylaria bambusicola]KAI0528209.1 kinase-like domain-containing protein [Xylaria bambusicola]
MSPRYTPTSPSFSYGYTPMSPTYRPTSPISCQSYAPVSLPYFAPSDALPEPLPTLEQVLSCQDFLAHPNAYLYKRVSIVRIGKFVAKYGKDVRSVEGETMLLVKSTTAVPVPEVYAIYTFGEDDEMTMLITEFVEGLPLGDYLESMTVEQVDNIQKQLTAQMDILRCIPAQGYYGAIGRRPFIDPYSSEEYGPYDEYTDFNTAWFGIYFPHNDTKRFTDIKKFFTISFECIATAKRHTYPVFTHGDLHEENIIVRSCGTPVIIDYETAGFYPAYHERLVMQNNRCPLDILSEEFSDECEMEIDARNAWNKAERERESDDFINLDY